MGKYENIVLRSRALQKIREFFISRDFLEVETPARIPTNMPEEQIDPVESGNWQLQTSPEICMKRLLCRGYKKIFQLSRCWRRDERGSRHLTEFSMLEWYRAEADYKNLMDDCGELITFLGKEFSKTSSIFTKKIEKISIEEAFKRYSDISLSEALEKSKFDEIIAMVIEPSLPKHSIILYDYPIEAASLSRLKNQNNNFAERFELYCNGIEIANGFSELNLYEEQKNRFEKSNEIRVSYNLKPIALPVKFLNEIEFMPESAGIALGIDRLMMLLCDAEKIDDVVCFTTEEL